MPDQTAAIAASRAYVGFATGPISLALATDTPIVCMYTITQPDQMIYDRAGGMKQIIAPIECAGCQGDWDEPLTYFQCRRGDNKCITLFDPVEVAEAAIEMTNAKTS